MIHPLPKERKARIFRNGRSRAVRIPQDFDLEGDEVIIRQETDGVITIHPGKKKGLLALLATMDRLGEDDAMPEIEDFPPEPVDLGRTEKR
jgi:antitoxin VapB